MSTAATDDVWADVWPDVWADPGGFEAACLGWLRRVKPNIFEYRATVPVGFWRGA